MDTQHQIWQYWAERLHHWGVGDIAATLLEATGPLRVFAAQLAYLGQPVLQPWLAPGTFQALVGLFENDQQAESFLSILREDR